MSILLAALFTLGAGLLLSPLAVFFTDMVEMIGVLLSILMYLTPIFYPMEIVPERRYLPLVRFNPVRSILEVFRDPIFYGKVPPLTHLERLRSASRWSRSSSAPGPSAAAATASPSTSDRRPMDDLSIRLETVSLCYRLAKQRIPSLKEYAIHFLRGSLSYEKLWALRDIDLTVRRGETVGIVGRNGAGKSTLLKVISRVLKPTEGSARIRGRLAPILELGTGFDYELTGLENIYLNALLLGHTKREIDGQGRRDRRLQRPRRLHPRRRSATTPPACRPASASRSPPPGCRTS